MPKIVTQEIIDAKLQNIVAQIAARKTKGWAFGPGTDAEKIERIDGVKTSIKTDFENMTRSEFVQTYSLYATKTEQKYLLCHATKAEVEKHKAGEAEREAEEKKKEYEAMLERFPPNRKFYSYTNLTDEKWHRYDSLPTAEQLEKAKAIRWNARLTALAGKTFGSFCVTAIHFGGLVIEFEYVYDGERLYDPQIN